MSDAADARNKAILSNDVVSVRYQIADVPRAIEFYQGHLGFKLEMAAGSAFASVSLGNLRLLLSGPDGRKQEPGGWNRILIYVEDLEKRVQSLKAAGVPFRNAIERGPGGSQILIEDPDGNAIELHQPA